MLQQIGLFFQEVQGLRSQLNMPGPRRETPFPHQSDPRRQLSGQFHPTRAFYTAAEETCPAF